MRKKSKPLTDPDHEPAPKREPKSEAKRKRALRKHRCAETGEFVTPEYAEANPKTTVRES